MSSITADEDPKPPRPMLQPEERMQTLTNITVDVNDAVPIKRYFRSSNEIIRMAGNYLDEGNLEKSFQLYLKHIVLYVERLPKHVEYAGAEPVEKERVKKKCAQIIPICEKLKEKLNEKYRLQYEDYLRRKESYESEMKARRLARARLEQLRLKEAETRRNESTSSYVSSLQSQIDKKKRELAEKKLEKPGDDNYDDSGSSDEEVFVEDVLQDQNGQEMVVPSAPMAALSLMEESEAKDASAASKPRPTQPSVDRSTKPSIYDDYEEETGGLSTLVIPFEAIQAKFTSIAQSNTSRNIETCGFLAGFLAQGIFTITHLLVPKQSGTADTCSATNEEELAGEQERLGLITLGWIHTHPSQNAFLSSVDLHTHAPYQKMLPEAVAIVIAPNQKETGIYSMSEWGLDYVLQCRESGFHQHPNEAQIYGSEPAHVRLDSGLGLEVIDFR